MKGEAGHGKTVFCLKLLESWSKPCVNDELSDILSVFDLVFFVPLRLVRKETLSVNDMICEGVSGGCTDTIGRVKRMLCNGKIRCLVILDGLDEWRIPSSGSSAGVPDTYGLVNCVLFFTMRPWKLAKLSLGLFKGEDKVVEIQGLKSSSVEDVIRKVLTNFYGADSSIDEKVKSMLAKSKTPMLQSLMKIPIMLTASCHVWCEEENDVGSNNLDKKSSLSSCYFMTGFFLSLVETMIKRAENKHGDFKSVLQGKHDNLAVQCNIMEKFPHLCKFIGVLKPVLGLAFHDIMSEKTRLVFEKDELESRFGSFVVDSALKTGLISQAKAPGKFHQQNISVSFYHKTIQEFLTAVYIICGGKDALTSFFTQCNTVDKAMDLSYVIHFVSGLNPMLGCELIKHIKDITNNDTDVILFREELGRFQKVKQLYKLHCDWFKEMKHNLAFTQEKNQTVKFPLSDVYISSDSNNEIFGTTKELMKRHNSDIVSVCVFCGLRFSFRDIKKYLPLCKNIQTFSVLGVQMKTVPDVMNQIHQRYSRITECGYENNSRTTFENENEVGITDLQNLTKLKHLELVNITFSDASLASEYREESPRYLVQRYKHKFDGPFINTSELETEAIAELNLTNLETVTLSSVRGPIRTIISSLPLCRKLTSIQITNIFEIQDHELLADVLPGLVSLHHIKYDGQLDGNMHQDTPRRRVVEEMRGRELYRVNTKVLRSLLGLSQLRRIELVGVHLIENDISFASITRLQSLTIDGLNGSVCCIFSSLCQCPHLGSLSINKMENRMLLACKLPDLKHLHHISYFGTSSENLHSDWKRVHCPESAGDTAVVNSVQSLRQVKSITLRCIDLSMNDSVTFSFENMNQLESVHLRNVRMSHRSWVSFVTSLVRNGRRIHVQLSHTNIGNSALSFIHSSKRIVVKEDKFGQLCFDTI